jgi:hypothetical protein
MAGIPIGGPTEEDILREGGTIDQIGPDVTTPHQSSPGADLMLGMDAKSWTAKHGNWIDKWIMPAFRGANKALAYLPDAVINTAAQGMGFEHPDILRRIFASGDYETKKDMVWGLLKNSIGSGDYVGPKGGAKLIDAFGSGVGFTVPFLGWQSVVSQQAAKTTPKIVREAATIFGRKGKGVDALDPTVAGKVIESVSRPYVAAPLTAATVETTMGGSAGTAFEVGEDLGEGWGPWFTIPGMFAPIGIYGAVKHGVLPPSVWAAKKLFQAAKWGKKRVTEGKDLATGKEDLETSEIETAKIIRSKVGEEFKDAIEANEANLKQSLEIEDSLAPYTGDEGFRFTVAEGTLDEPAIKSQLALEAAAKPALTRKLNARKKAFRNALSNFIKGEFGGDLNEGMMYLYNNLSGKYIPLLTKIEEGIITNTDNITQIYSRGLIDSRTKTGESIQIAVKKALENVDEEAKKMAIKLGINVDDEAVTARVLKMSQNRLKNNLQVSSKLGEEALSYEGMPKEFIRYMKFNKIFTFQDYKTFRSQVGDGLGKAIAQGNSTNIKVLSILKKELDKMAINYGQSNKNFEKFRIWYQANRIEPFESGAVHKVMEPQGPAFKLPGELVARQFITNTKDAQAFINLFADDAIMMGNMQASVFDDMMRSGVIKPTSAKNPELKINSNALNTYLTKNKEVLETLRLRNSGGTGVLDDQISALQSLSNRATILSSFF